MIALAASLLLLAAPPTRAPAFELTALGTLGGDTDTNLTSFLLAVPGQPPTLLIDGGSVMPGLQRMLELEGRLSADASPTVRARAALEVLKPLRAFLLTHAHLDHWGGFMDASTLEVLLALQGKPPLPLVGLPETTEAMRAHLFGTPLWVDFTAIPPKSPALALQALPPGKPLALEPFQVETVLLDHTVPAAAFLVHRGGAAYLHLGDTGPTTRVWDAARPTFEKHQLRAIAIEVSFADADQKLALGSGHLTPHLLLLELNKLAHAVKSPPDAASMTDAQALELARALAPAFRDCPIVTIHIKALGYDAVVQQLKPLQEAGLNLVVPEQGRRYSF